MDKILKPKAMRRGVLALLLIAPLIYMFGSLFFALNGAHEGMDINDDNSYQYIYTKRYNAETLRNKSISAVTGNTYENNTKSVSEFIPVEVNSKIVKGEDTLSVSMVAYYDSNQNYIGVIEINHFPDTLFDDSIGYVKIVYDNIYSSSITYTFEYYDFINSSNSDYLFGQFFAKDNWLAKLGETTLNGENVYGFHALSDLLKYMDNNAFHIGETDWGKLIYGYATYAVNVLILYELIAIGIYVLMIPLKVTDWFGEKGGLDL